MVGGGREKEGEGGRQEKEDVVRLGKRRKLKRPEEHGEGSKKIGLKRESTMDDHCIQWKMADSNQSVQDRSRAQMYC